VLGLIVVHGIGDPSPGEALRDVTDAMEAEGIASFDAVVQERRLLDVRSRNNRLKFFPVHLRTGVLKGTTGQPVIAAEVFWGSASQLARGRWGVLQGMASLLLNVPTLVMGAKGGKSFVAVVSWWASMTLASVAFALNTLLMLTLAVYIALCYVVGAPPGRWELAAPVVASAVTFGLSWHNWLWFREACLAFRYAGPICLLVWLITERTLLGFSTVTVWMLGVTIAFAAALVLTAGIAFAAQRLAGNRAPEPVTAALSLSLQFGLWTLIVPIAWQGLFTLVPKDGEQQWMVDAFAKAAAANGLQWPLALAVMAAFGFVTIRRLRQAAAGRRAERLILHPVIGTTLVVAVMIGAAIVLLGTIRPGWIKPAQDLAARVPNVKLVGAALLLVPLLTSQLRHALDLAYDVMYYLYYATEPGRRLLSRTRDDDRGNNPPRHRFYAVVNHLLEQELEHLVILAHSQGTVIALDELTHSWSTKRPLPPITLVTCGSPISQLYQHYFPTFYPDWSSSQWMVFFSRVVAWNNFYRLDDYVGTTITPPPPFGGEFRQEPVGRGGHTDYWRDPNFIRALKRRVFDPVEPSS
jgi:hypothetical protein